jgi:hypothetical protein
MPAVPRPVLVSLLAVAAGLALAACASSSIQTDAVTFLDEHGREAVRDAQATRSVEAGASGLTRSTSRPKVHLLSRTAEIARRADVEAGEWNLANAGEGGEEGLEEEDLPRAEVETTEAAGELATAMTALQAYLRTSAPDSLDRYRTELARGRERWNESVTQLWHLAHRSSPPTL